MVISEKHYQVISQVAYQTSGSLGRNSIVRAFKAAGAKVASVNNRLYVSHDGVDISLAGGDITLNGHATFRQVLGEMAIKLLGAQVPEPMLKTGVQAPAQPDATLQLPPLGYRLRPRL